jgi:PhnB protein
MENDNSYTVAISAESKEETDKLFNGLSDGGKVEMPIDCGPSGNYNGMLADKFGVKWIVEFDPE